MDQTDRRMFARRAWHFVAAAVLLAGCSTTPLTPPRVLDDAPTQAMIETLEQAARSEPDRM